MDRPDVHTALAGMRGKEIGLLMRPNGSARVQWPDAEGRLPANMRRFTVGNAVLNEGMVVMDLSDADMSCTFQFALEHIVP